MNDPDVIRPWPHPIRRWTRERLKLMLIWLGYDDFSIDEAPHTVDITVRISKWWWLAFGIAHALRRRDLAASLEPGRPAGITYNMKVR